MSTYFKGKDSTNGLLLFVFWFRSQYDTLGIMSDLYIKASEVADRMDYTVGDAASL